MVINYILTILAVYLGLPLGVLLASIAPEELKPGESYFKHLRKIFFAIAVFLIIFFQREMLFLIIWVIAAIIFYLQLYWSKYLSLFFAVLLFVAKESSTLFLLAAVTTFLFFMIEGTLFAKQHQRMLKKQRLAVIKKVVLEYWPFLLGLPLHFL